MYKKRENLIESNIPGFGFIPENFTIGRLKHIFNFSKGKKAQLYTGKYVSENSGEHPVYSGQTGNNGIMGSVSTYDYDQEGMIVTTVGAKAMTLFLVNGKFSLSQNCALIDIKNKGLKIKYYYYYLQYLFEQERKKLMTIMIPSLRIDDLNQYDILIPPQEDQEKIANFLDKEVGKIDLIIKKEKELLEKTKQKKEVLIYNTVTKGLDKDIEMVESGIKGIGKIPKGWILRKIKHIAKTYVGNSISDDKKDLYPYITGAIPYISTKNIEQGTNTIDYNVDIFTVKKDLFKEAPKSSTLLCIEGGSAGNKIGFLDRSVSFGNKLCCFVGNKFNNKKYIYYYLQSNIFKNDFYESMTGMIGGVSQNSLKNIKFIQPPQEDQEKIANFLDKEVGKIDLVMGKIENQIKKYKEFKESLIFNAVTGKIEVE